MTLSSRQTRAGIVVALVLIMMAALALRLFHLERESLWWDEYATHVHLDAPTLAEFLSLNRTLDPLTLPFYYCFEYLWTRHVCATVWSLRLMGILIGLATIPFLYFLGKRCFGSAAGMTAVLMFALSPVHIHHSQGIRMYGMVVFLAAVTAWSFVRLLEDRRVMFWLIHLGGSAALYWTHPFAALLPGALGLFLAGHHRVYRWFVLRWALMQAMLFLPVAAYLATARFWPQGSTDAWLASPTLGGVLADLFFDDIVSFQWQFRLGPTALTLGWLRFIPDALFALMILALALYVLVPAMSDIRRERRGGAVALLAMWLILPPLALFLVSLLVRPCMFPRYTVHCSLALYLLLGGAIQRMPRRGCRVGAVAALAVLMLMQWLWLQPGPQRTDWRSAGLLLHERTGPGDMVLVRNTLWREVFVHNLEHMTPGLLAAPVAAGETSWTLAAQTALALGLQEERSCAENQAVGGVWAVLAMDFFVPGPPLDYEFALGAWGLDYERWFFPAVREVFVYRVHARDSRALPRDLEGVFAQWKMKDPDDRDRNAHGVQAFGDLAMALAERGRTGEAVAVLKSLTAGDPFAAKAYASLLRALENRGDVSAKTEAVRALYQGYGYRKNNQSRFAVKAFQQAAVLDPDSAILFYEWGMELFHGGRHQEAAAALERAGALDGEYAPVLSNLKAALEAGQDSEKALQAETAYREGLLAMSRQDTNKAAALLGECLRLNPRHLPAMSNLGYVLMLQEKLQEAKDFLERYVAACSAPDPRSYGNLALLYTVMEQPDKARESGRKALDADPEFRKTFGDFCRFLFEERRLAESLVELRRLKQTGIPFPPFVERYLSEQLGEPAPASGSTDAPG